MTNHLKMVIAVIVAAITSGIAPVASKAQITYTNDFLSIQGAPRHTFHGICIDKYMGMYWTCKSSNFFQLDLSPANPRIAGTGNQVVFYNTDTGKYNSIQVASVYNYSDARAKENVQTLNSGLNTILNLRPVTYTWKTGNSEADATLFSASDTPVAYGPEEDDMTQYGFLAQEVEEVMPDAVKTDEEGHKLINYTAIIPVLVQSVQELQGIIDEQNSTITSLKNKIVQTTSYVDENPNKLISCSPNPTQGEMTFTYELENICTDAYILISDLSGNQEMKISNLIGQSSTSKDLGSLRSGIHIATLVVNSKICDSQQIIVSR